MRKILITMLILLLSTGSLWASGGGSSSKPLDGAYPIVLAHGMGGWGDDEPSGLVSIIKYWGGMDDYLRSEGATVYAPANNPFNSAEVRAYILRDKINLYMASGGHSKIHLIGHSQGGLDTRYAISNLGLDSKVKTYTSMNSPHLGSPLVAIVKTVVPDWLLPFAGTIINNVNSVVYGGKASEYDIIKQLDGMSLDYMTAFNLAAPNQAGVKYFSYTSKMTWADPIQHHVMALLYPVNWAGGIFYGMGGANDGMVPVSSAKWGTYKGGPEYNWYVSGVDHYQSCNGGGLGGLWFDVEAYFLQVAKNAKSGQ